MTPVVSERNEENVICITQKKIDFLYFHENLNNKKKKKIGK